jgi:septum formation protein
LKKVFMRRETILYLGSKSPSRQQLLKNALFPFVLVEQSADETKCDWNRPLRPLVESIALYKMDCVLLPDGKEGDDCLVLTADTLSENEHGLISGKPSDRDDALKKLTQSRNGVMRTATAFCLDKKVFESGSWKVAKRVLRFVDARYRFHVPKQWVDAYLEHSMGQQCSGAIAIEAYGGLFLKDVQGSYTTIVGLPLYELREELEKFGFFSHIR